MEPEDSASEEATASVFKGQPRPVGDEARVELRSLLPSGPFRQTAFMRLAGRENPSGPPRIAYFPTLSTHAIEDDAPALDPPPAGEHA